MSWTLTSDLARYLRVAGPLLRMTAVENTIALTTTEGLRVRGQGAYGDEPALFGYWCETGERALSACMHTPPYGLVLTAMADEVASGLASELVDRGRFVPGVNGYEGTCLAFAQAWRQLTGQTARLQRRSRLHRLGALEPPDPGPPGRARIAEEMDRDLLVAWMEAFHEEVDIGPARGTARMVDDRLSYGGLTVWECEGTPVAMAGTNRAVADQVRIGPVYTPPDLRRQGFGAAVTAAVSQSAIDSGAEAVLLFTDLANPTSNALYRRLGYEAVSDRSEWAFETRRHDAP